MALSKSRRPAPLDLVRLDDRINPGTGTFTILSGPGPAKVEFNFSVAVRFDATANEMKVIKNAVLEGSRALKEATDGQHQFGLVTFVNNSGPTTDAELQVFRTSGTGEISIASPFAAYGERGPHIRLYYDRALAIRTPEESGNIIAHEFGHHLYDLDEHYVGPNPAFLQDVPGATRTLPTYDLSQLNDSATLSFSLMDRPLDRGGRLAKNLAISGQITQREFSVAGNHDRNAPNEQNFKNRRQDGSGEADWETIKRISDEKGYPITVPEGLPSDERYPDHTIRVIDSNGPASVTVVFDRSGSIDPVRLGYAQNAARLVSRYLAPTDRLGLISFADQATVDATLRLATGPNVSNFTAAVNAIAPIGGTNITDGLEDAIDQISFQEENLRTPNEILLLLTDGDNTTDVSPLTLIPRLQFEGISVFAIGIGNDLSVAGRDTLSQLTGANDGFAYSAPTNFELISSFFRASMAVLNYTFLGSTEPVGVAGPTVNGPPERRAERTFFIDPNTEEAIFAMSQIDTERPVNLLLTSPTGQKFTVGINDNKVSTFVDGAVQSIRIKTPVAGTWKLTASVPQGGEPNLVQLFAAASRSTIQISTSVKPPASYMPMPPGSMPPGPMPPGAMPEATIVTATVTSGGQSVFGATVTALVTRPDGTRVTMTLVDDGKASSGDTFVDGVYTGKFTQYASEGNGSYQFDVMVDTSNGKAMTIPVSGYPLPPGSDPLLPAPVDPSAQSMTNSVVLDNIPEIPGGSVSGRVFDDLNSNRRYDAGEPGVADLLVYPDFNQNGERDGTEPFAFTDAQGLYVLEISDPGSYTIRVQLPEGLTRNSADPVGEASGNNTTTGVDLSLGDPDAANPDDPSPPPPPPPPPPPTGDVLRRFVVGGTGVSLRDGAGIEVSSTNAFGGSASGLRVALGDFTGDGVPDIVAGTGPGSAGLVRILDGVSGAVVFETSPFEASFRGGVFVVAGDVTGDGRADLVVTPGQDGGPRVVVYDGNGFAQRANFFWLDEDFRGGATAAVADLTGDGIGELIVGAGFGGGPRVATFGLVNGTPTRVAPDFFAFESTTRTGLYLAAGDIDGDGRADVVVSAGHGGGPRVSVFHGPDLVAGTVRRVADFFAGPETDRDGARVATRDILGTTAADLIVSPGRGGRVSVYAGPTLGSPTLEFDVAEGVFVG